MSFKLTEEQADKAVKWWGNILAGNPKFQTLNPKERRNKANEGVALTEIMATVARKKIDVEKISVFESSLKKKLLADEYSPHHGLHTDYGPGTLLAHAAHTAGIEVNITTFPWKTNMWFNENGTVKVRYGYGADVREI